MKRDIDIQISRCFKSLLLLVAIGTFLTTSAFGANDPQGCSTNAESRKLDYWVGNWTLADAGAASSTSKVYLSLDKCMFIEHWENGKGHVTEKMLAYSPEDKSWYGMFADNEGRVHVFVDGTVGPGTAEFHGQSRGSNGEMVLNRLKIVQQSPNKIVETWEKSTDRGAHWTKAYSAEYSRVNS